MIALLLVTKNEAELLELNLDHHLAWGFDRIAVADNESTDATADICARHPAEVTRVPFRDFHVRQTMRHTMLRRFLEETDGCLEWAAIGDTDEFWWSPRPLREILAEVPRDVVAVNFDAKLYLPTGLDDDTGSVNTRRHYRTSGGDSALHTSYTVGKTIYRAEWLASLPVDHWCARHEHLCREVPHPEWRHPEAIVHHYMIQDEAQFVEKVVRLIEWAKPPTSRRRKVMWHLTPKRRRPLPPWSEPWKKDWWQVYQREGIDGVQRFYRTSYVVPAGDVDRYVASGDLVRDDALARYTAERTA
jgi:hypothetical protein